MATEIVQFATGKKKPWERRSPMLSGYSDTNRLVPLAGAAVIVGHAGARRCRGYLLRGIEKS